MNFFFEQTKALQKTKQNKTKQKKKKTETKQKRKQKQKKPYPFSDFLPSQHHDGTNIISQCLIQLLILLLLLSFLFHFSPHDFGPPCIRVRAMGPGPTGPVVNPSLFNTDPK